MAIRTKDEILELVKAKIGEDVSDEAISFIEDITDTLSDYEKRLSDSTDWESKYNALDNDWREKYKSRFFKPTTEVIDDVQTVEENENLQYEDLFEEKKGDE